MALRTVSKVFRIRNCSICSRNIFPSLSVYDSQPQVFQQRNYQEGQNRSKEKQHKENGKKWDTRIPIATGFGLSAVAVVTGLYHHFENTDNDIKKIRSFDHSLNAEEDKEKTAIDQREVLQTKYDKYDKRIVQAETIYRRTNPLDRIFDYFASYRYINKNGRNVNLMSVKDFYNAVSPGSLLTHGTGLKSEKDFIIVTDDDIASDILYQSEELPVPNSILNKIQKQGLLSYTDFCFLINILATPSRYLDISFLAFDIIADGNIHANEYLKVLTRITKHTGGLRRYDECGTYEELIRTKYSGLMAYFFGPRRTKAVKKDKFLKFRQQLIDDILWLEFVRYCRPLPDLPNLPPQQFPVMTDIDFCEHLLENTNFPAKKKAQMIGRVAKFFGESASNPTQLCEGITFDGFRSFYHVMYCGADLERAMYFCDLDHGGITKDEFLEFSKNISDVDVDDHIVDVLYLLLDQDGLITKEGLITRERRDGLLSLENFSPLLSEWRNSRAFTQASAKGASIIDLKLT